MLLRELVFQGIYGHHKPTRLTFERDIGDVALPPSITINELREMITALFYPSWLSPQARETVESSPVKLAVTFDFRSRRYRLVRKSDMESIKLQVRDEESFVDVIAGVEVEDLLLQKMRFPSYHTFCVLHFWQFDQPLPKQAVGANLGNLDAKSTEIVRSYRIAVAHERMEDRVKGLEGELAQARQTLGDGAKLEDKLSAAKQRLSEIQVNDLADNEIALLRSREERTLEFNEQIERLEQEEGKTRAQVDATMPDSPVKDPLFGGGLILALGALGASFVVEEALRFIALLDVIGLTMCAWALLQYFVSKERSSVHLVRLESIKRRFNQVREEHVAFHDRLHHLLIHAGVKSEEELNDRFEKSQRLSGIIDKMQAQYEKVSRRPDYQKASREVKSLSEALKQAQQEFEQMPKSVLSAYQLESDLQTLGIDPRDTLEDSGEESSAIPYDRDMFTRLAEAARQTNQMSSQGLAPKAQGMWAKIVGHVLGGRFKSLTLNDKGEIDIQGMNPQQLQLWQNTRRREAHVVGASLALALLANAPESEHEFRSLIIELPERTMSSEHANRLAAVFESASKRVQIIFVESPL